MTTTSSTYKSTRAATVLALTLIFLAGAIGCGHNPAPGRATQATATETVPTESVVPHRANMPHPDMVMLTIDVGYLASDKLGGRGMGSPGLQDALEFIGNRFLDLGLEPPGGSLNTPEGVSAYFQQFHSHGQPASANVIGLLPGDPAAETGAVIIGAHIDHLGTDPSLPGDTIYNGAEDNASGVAALLNVASNLVQWRKSLSDISGIRTIVFIAFSGEEVGLLGSKHYAAHPVIPHRETLAMINLDSVGRLRENEFYIFGTGSAKEFPAIIEGLNQSAGLNLITQSFGVGGSDHVSFLDQGVPALHLFTGPHEDYHKVSDEVDKVSFTGLVTVSEFAGELTRYLAYRARSLTFVAAEKKPKKPAMAQPGKRRASSGFMPDFSRESGGVKVGRVTPGGAAEKAGLREGDIIVSLGGESTDTLADYSALLRSHAPGDEVIFTVLRGEGRVDLAVVLQAK